MTLWHRLAQWPHADSSQDEVARHARRGRLLGYLDGLRQDIRYGCRMLVTANFFQVMGVEPELGRAFRAAEDQVPGRAVMLSHELWQRQFGADPAILGRTMRLNGIAFTVVGVTLVG